jgi:hypothetical protein
MKFNFLIIWFLVWMPESTCINNNYLKTIDAYLNADSVAEKSKYMADNYRAYFMNEKDEGENKSQALQSFQNWDGPMHPDVKINSYTFGNGMWKVTFNEQNDFSKAIDFPGWNGTTTFTFNSAGLIEETIYVPDSNNISYKPFLQPALDWLQKNMPGELSEVYQNNKLVKTETAANKWKQLLQQWQLQKNPKE